MQAVQLDLAGALLPSPPLPSSRLSLQVHQSSLQQLVAPQSMQEEQSEPAGALLPSQLLHCSEPLSLVARLSQQPPAPPLFTRPSQAPARLLHRLRQEHQVLPPVPSARPSRRPRPPLPLLRQSPRQLHTAHPRQLQVLRALLEVAVPAHLLPALLSQWRPLPATVLLVWQVSLSCLLCDFSHGLRSVLGVVCFIQR